LEECTTDLWEVAGQPAGSRTFNYPTRAFYRQGRTRLVSGAASARHPEPRPCPAWIRVRSVGGRSSRTWLTMNFSSPLKGRAAVSVWPFVRGTPFVQGNRSRGARQGAQWEAQCSMHDSWVPMTRVS